MFMRNRAVIIDVGANEGAFVLEILDKNPNVFVLAIEPIPELCAQIRAKALEIGRSTDVEVLTCAVDMQERQAEFNVAVHADQGVSSLLNLSDSEIQKDDYWKTRSDLYFDKKIQVQVRRLDNILSELGISHVSFVKIDVQGLDVQVLRSMGEYLSRVDCGMLEITSTLGKRLYEGEEYDLRRALNDLEVMGFEVYSIKPNDPASNEFNIFFCRKGVDYKQLEQTLSLPLVQLYSGKNYWHAPSAQYRPLQEADVAKLQGRISELDVEVSRLERAIHELNELIEQQKCSLNVEVHASSYERSAQQAEQKLAAVYASKSWAVTRPMRFAVGMVRKLLGRGG
jgi:FkbM family methyltransferase